MRRIEELFAFVVENPEPDQNEEGIIGVNSPIGVMPIVFSRREMIEKYRPICESQARLSGKKLRLLHFSVREEIE